LGYETRQLTVPPNVSSFASDIYDGRLPQKVIVCQVATDAFDGSYKANPLFLKSFNLKSVSLLINNNEVVPSTPYSKVEEAFSYSRLYIEALRILGIDVNYIDFQGGNLFVAFDLRRDRHSNVVEQAEIKTEGHIRIHTEFTQDVEKPFTLVCIFEFAKALCIKSTGHVFHM